MTENSLVAAILIGSMIPPLAKLPSSVLHLSDDPELAKAGAITHLAVHMHHIASRVLDRQGLSTNFKTGTVARTTRALLTGTNAQTAGGANSDVDLQLIAAIIVGGILPPLAAPDLRQMSACFRNQQVGPVLDIVTDALTLYQAVFETLKSVGRPPLPDSFHDQFHGRKGGRQTGSSITSAKNSRRSKAPGPRNNL